jgi:hypothetical protein
MKMPFTVAFQSIFKSCGYLSCLSIVKGPPALIRGFK